MLAKIQIEKGTNVMVGGLKILGMGDRSPWGGDNEFVDYFMTKYDSHPNFKTEFLARFVHA